MKILSFVLDLCLKALKSAQSYQKWSNLLTFHVHMLPKNSSKLNFSKKPFLVVDLYFVVVCKVYVKDFFPTFSKNFPLTIVNRYTVRKSFPESNAFQYSERTMATIETNITSTKSPSLIEIL